MTRFLNEYEKICKLGKGAFANVYKVRHADLGYIRALKVSMEYIEDENDKAWKTFLKECKVLLRIGNGYHPNIVHIYPPKLIEHRAVVEMDCVEGESLYQYIKDQEIIPMSEVLNFIRQIVGAMAFCHHDVYKYLMDANEDKLEIDPDNGRKFIISPEKERELVAKYRVIHNDLHSNNVIRREDGQFILLDFGLAIQEEHCVKSSSRGDGAIEYSSPEKLENNRISTESDVYALGVLLYEILTGRVPFPCTMSDSDSPESARVRVYQQHLHDKPAPIGPLRKAAFEASHPESIYEDDMPIGLEDIVMKCLEKDPAKRYHDAKALLQDCVGCMEEQPEMPLHNVATNPTKESEVPISDTETMAQLKAEMQAMREEIASLKGASSKSESDVSQGAHNESHSPAREMSRGKFFKDWAFKKLNIYWIVALAAVCIICGVTISYRTYGDSELIGSIAMGCGLFSVCLPWFLSWRNPILKTLCLLIWVASVIAAICFAPEWSYGYMSFGGLVGLLALILQWGLSTKKS